jgi:hypothetical protein
LTKTLTLLLTIHAAIRKDIAIITGLDALRLQELLNMTLILVRQPLMP